MNPVGFHAPSAGRVTQSPGGYAAFVPAPLPPELTYDGVLVRALSRADAALSELAGRGGSSPIHICATLGLESSRRLSAHLSNLVDLN